MNAHQRRTVRRKVIRDLQNDEWYQRLVARCGNTCELALQGNVFEKPITYNGLPFAQFSGQKPDAHMFV